MSVEVKVPVLPESVADALVATWHKQVGDAVSIDEKLVDIETEKVVLEVPSTTFSVSISTIFSSTLTLSPTCLCQVATVASDTDSGKTGTFISIFITV